MGHYDSCYKHDEIERQKARDKEFKAIDKKINKAIFEIKTLQLKYAKDVDTMMVCNVLDKALYKLGWNFAKFKENR